MATTIARLSEEINRLLSGGNTIQAASNISDNELRIAIGQVANKRLKAEYFATNLQLGETIANGSMLGLYEDIEVVSYNGKSKSTLPIKPIQMPRNMGVFAIYPKYKSNGNYDLDNEFVPLQMGQGGLLKSQSLINDLLGQIGYEVFGGDVIYTKDIKSLFPDVVVAMRLAIMDFSQYGDYDILPITPEIEWDIKNEVVKLYSGIGISDNLVDSTTKNQQNIPVKQQQQT